MNPKLLLGLALVLSSLWFGSLTDLFADEAGKNDGFQLETEVNIVESAASDGARPVTSWTNEVPWMAMDDALDKLDGHYSLWATNTSISPRLSSAVLKMFPSLADASMRGPQPGNQMWCNAVNMLAKSHDLAMIAVLRPFLKSKVVAGDGSLWFEDRTPMRACDKAAIAIVRLLGDKNFAGGGFAFSGGILVAKVSYPKWNEWDKKIAELQKRLDKQPEKNSGPPAQTHSRTDGVTLQIYFPSTEGAENHAFPGFLILSNGGNNDIRYSLLCDLHASNRPGADWDNVDVDWMPGFLLDDPPSAQRFAQSVQTLKPGESAQKPFGLYEESTNDVHVTAHYLSGHDFGLAKGLNLLTGEVDAEAVIVRFTNSPHYPLQRQLKTSWGKDTNVLYSLAGTSIPVIGMKGSYEFEIAANLSIAMPVEVFIDENNQKIWAGKKCDLYVDDGNGIVGITLSFGNLRFEKSAFAKARLTAGGRLDDLVTRFDTQVDHSQLLMGRSTINVGLQAELGPWFFATSPHGSQSGQAKIVKTELQSGILQMDLDSPNGIDKGSIWVDVRSKKLLKAVRNNYQVFPKPVPTSATSIGS